MTRTAWPIAAVLVLALAGPLAAQTATDSTGTNPNATSPSTGTTDNGTPHKATTHKHRTKHHRRMRKHNANAADSTGTSGTLPKTSSPLPALAASGIATLALGTWLSRRRNAI